MGWFEGLLSGYTDRLHTIQADEAAQAEAARAREETIYQTLLKDRELDPQIHDMAAAGLLGMGDPQKRKSGFAGWMGELEKSPYLPAIQRFHQANRAAEPEVTVPRQPSVPKGPSGAIPTPPAAAGSAALPAESVTTPGGPHITAPTFEPGYEGPPQPPPGTFSLAPGGAKAPTGVPGAVPPPNLRPGAPGAVPGAMPGASGQLLGAPPMPPPPPASPAAKAMAGMPGGATQTPGPAPAPPRPKRTNLFASQADLQRQQVEAGIEGTINGYQQMYERIGHTPEEASVKAAELYEDTHIRGGSYAQPVPQFLEYTDPTTGQVVQTMGYFDKQSRTYHDSQGRPITTNVTRAMPASSMNQGVIANQVMTAKGWTLADLRNDPAKAQVVQDEVTRIMGERAAVTTRERMQEQAVGPISSNTEVGLTARYQGMWNAIQQPVRNMEIYGRIMRQAYDRYKAGDKSAWEQLRTAFVKISEPNSVVMPSEFARSAGIGSLLQQIAGHIGKAVEGGSPLPDEIIDEMMRLAVGTYEGAMSYGAQQKSAIEHAISDPRVMIPKEAVFGTAPSYDMGAGLSNDLLKRPVTPAATGGGANPATAAPTGAPVWVKDPTTGQYVRRTQ